MHLTPRGLVLVCGAILATGTVLGIATTLAPALTATTTPTTATPTNYATVTDATPPVGDLGDEITSFPRPTVEPMPVIEPSPSSTLPRPDPTSPVQLEPRPAPTTPVAASPRTPTTPPAETPTPTPTAHGQATPTPSNSGEPFAPDPQPRPRPAKVTRVVGAWHPPVLHRGTNTLSVPTLTSGSRVEIIAGCSPRTACTLTGDQLVIAADATSVTVTWWASRRAGYPDWGVSRAL